MGFHEDFKQAGKRTDLLKLGRTDFNLDMFVCESWLT